jgi:hypothetical protein
MRRGQDHRPTYSEHSSDPGNGFTKQELVEASGLSPKTFDTIRKAARVRGPGHGGLDWLFSISDVIALIQRAESGSFSERGGAPAAAWRALLAERGINPPQLHRRR